MSFFDVAYGGTPAWDIGRPQPAVVRLADEGAISGSVIDVGCGTGENALFLAERGLEVLGVDLAERAILAARRKAAEREIGGVEFRVWDALRIDELGRRFDTALDVGLFHTLADDERPVYAEALRSALRVGGRAFLLCWSERNAWGFGPRRVTQMEILGTFERDWRVGDIVEATFASRFPEPIHAWLASLERET